MDIQLGLGIIKVLKLTYKIIDALLLKMKYGSLNNE